MFIDRAYRPWLACATDDDVRPSLHHVLIERLGDEEAARWGCNGVAVAANGYLLAVVPVELEPEEGTCLIHRRFWPSLMRSCLSLDGRVEIPLRTPKERFVSTPDGWACRKGLLDTLRFPKWRSIVPPIPAEAPGLATLGINANLLTIAQRAIGSPCGVQLRFCRDNHGPVVVGGLGELSAKASGVPPFGIVMPMFVETDPLPARRLAGAVSGAGDGI